MATSKQIIFHIRNQTSKKLDNNNIHYLDKC